MFEIHEQGLLPQQKSKPAQPPKLPKMRELRSNSSRKRDP
jgi:hypothetical protein